MDFFFQMFQYLRSSILWFFFNRFSFFDLICRLSFARASSVVAFHVWTPFYNLTCRENKYYKRKIALCWMLIETREMCSMENHQVLNKYIQSIKMIKLSLKKNGLGNLILLCFLGNLLSNSSSGICCRRRKFMLPLLWETVEISCRFSSRVV